MFAEVFQLPGNDREVTNPFSPTLYIVIERTLLCFRYQSNPLSAQLSAGPMEMPWLWSKVL
jgi:hypothetical protein